MVNSFSSTSFTSTSFTSGVTPPGVKIQGRQAIQQTVQKRRKTKLINVEFSFWLISVLTKRLELKLLNFQHKLNPKGFYTNALRESFVLPLTELRQKLKPLSKQALEDTLESIISDSLDDPLWCFKYLNDKIKRLKNGKRK